MKKKSILLFLLAMTAVGMYANDGVGQLPDDSLHQQYVNWQEDCGALSANKNDYAGLNALRSRMASATTSDNSTNKDSLQLAVGVPVYFYFKLNTAQLVTKSQLANLTEIAKYAKEHHLTIHITGAADEATGTAKRNRALSIARARYIAKQFINNGIEKSQMKAVSLGGIREFKPKEANRLAMVVLRE
jgi:outer membrane protein OmpA-like peptidoglycan-associated protein